MTFRERGTAPSGGVRGEIRRGPEICLGLDDAPRAHATDSSVNPVHCRVSSRARAQRLRAKNARGSFMRRLHRSAIGKRNPLQ